MRRDQTAKDRAQSAEKQRNARKRCDQNLPGCFGAECLPQQVPEPEHEGILIKLQTTSFLQISRQPGDVEKPAVGQAEILEPEQPHGSRAEQSAPRHARGGQSLFRILVEQPQFCSGSVLLGPLTPSLSPSEGE